MAGGREPEEEVWMFTACLWPPGLRAGRRPARLDSARESRRVTVTVSLSLEAEAQRLSLRLPLAWQPPAWPRPLQ
jgi:hypothetical protein